MKDYYIDYSAAPGSFFNRLFRIIPIFLLTILLAATGCSKKAQSPPKPAAPVKTAVSTLKDVPIQLLENGTVEAYSIVNITSRVDGQVIAVHIKEGQQVKKDQLLFSIDDRPFQAALRSANSNLLRDRIRLEKAAKDARRYADLLKKDYVTRTQAEQAQTDAKSLEAIVKGDEAALENARLNVSWCEIKAPISGRAGEVLINSGNLIKANDTKPLMVIHQMQPIYVKFSVPEQFFSEIQKRMAMEAPGVTAAAPGKENMPVSGKLTFVDNTVNPDTGTLDLKASFENTDNGLWPGAFVNIALNLGQKPDVVVVPNSAVQMGQQGSYIFVVKKDLTVEVRPVVTGVRINGLTSVEKGLASGETVVIDGQLRLFPDAKVFVKNDAQPAGGLQQ